MSLHQEEEVFLFQFSPLFMCFTDEELIERGRENGGDRERGGERGDKKKLQDEGKDREKARKVTDGRCGRHTSVLIRVAFCQ